MSDQRSASQRLDGKVAIITGATGGIGEATAARFLDEGACVMLVGRSVQKLQDTADRLAGRGALAQFQADADDEQATAAAVAATVSAFGGIDILFANAGMEGPLKPLEQQELADFEAVLRTNVIGVWLAMKHCVAPLRARGGGSMIATSSIAGVIGFPGLAFYIASKHAVCGLVKTAAIELAASAIRVNAIAPGCIDNRMIRSIEEQSLPDNPDAVREAIVATIPMKRYGREEEVANLAVYLASDEASYTTGAIHLIDGGYTAG